MRIQTTCWLGTARRLAVPALTIALMALGALPASAQGTVLYGCYVPNSGTVYRIKAAGLPDACRSTQHVEFTWNLQGPAGPQGAAGPTGPQGPAGPAGGINARGVSYETGGSSEAIAPGQTGAASVGCPSGTIATGGGGYGWSENRPMHLVISRPTVGGWTITVENTSSAPGFALVYAVCVPVQ
jgi:hypothetical protein